MEPWFETHGFTVNGVYAVRTHLNGILTAFHMKYEKYSCSCWNAVKTAVEWFYSLFNGFKLMFDRYHGDRGEHRRLHKWLIQSKGVSGCVRLSCAANEIWKHGLIGWIIHWNEHFHTAFQWNANQVNINRNEIEIMRIRLSCAADEIWKHVYEIIE